MSVRHKKVNLEGNPLRVFSFQRAAGRPVQTLLQERIPSKLAGALLSGLPRAPCPRVALAVNIEQLLDVHMCVFLGRGQALVTQEFLDDAKVRAPA